MDSLREGVPIKHEGRQLQKLLLNHFEGKSFVDGRIATNEAQANELFI